MWDFAQPPAFASRITNHNYILNPFRIVHDDDVLMKASPLVGVYIILTISAYIEDRSDYDPFKTITTRDIIRSLMQMAYSQKAIYAAIHAMVRCGLLYPLKEKEIGVCRGFKIFNAYYVDDTLLSEYVKLLKCDSQKEWKFHIFFTQCYRNVIGDGGFLYYWRTVDRVRLVALFLEKLILRERELKGLMINKWKTKENCLEYNKISYAKIVLDPLRRHIDEKVGEFLEKYGKSPAVIEILDILSRIDGMSGKVGKLLF